MNVTLAWWVIAGLAVAVVALVIELIRVTARASMSAGQTRDRLDGLAPRIPNPRTLDEIQALVERDAKARGYR